MRSSRDILEKHINDEILLYFPNLSMFDKETLNRLLLRWSDDSIFSEKHRYELMDQLIFNSKSKKILDMAGGCGSFVLQGLRNGYNAYGVEPEQWKHDVIDAKFKENNYPKEWRDHLLKGIGEKLPFEDETFDIFDSWQTIEHVGDVRKCINELFRILKKGGSGILRGPDYIGFYEGHYRIFWFPLMGKSRLARLYLKLRKRPIEGLDTFNPVNSYQIRRYCREAGFKVVNIKREQVYRSAKRRIPALKKNFFRPFFWSFYMLLELLRGFRYFGRREPTISYLLVKEQDEQP